VVEEYDEDILDGFASGVDLLKVFQNYLEDRIEQASALQRDLFAQHQHELIVDSEDIAKQLPNDKTLLLVQVPLDTSVEVPDPTTGIAPNNIVASSGLELRRHQVFLHSPTGNLKVGVLGSIIDDDVIVVEPEKQIEEFEPPTWESIVAEAEAKRFGPSSDEGGRLGGSIGKRALEFVRSRKLIEQKQLERNSLSAVLLHRGSSQELVCRMKPGEGKVLILAKSHIPCKVVHPWRVLPMQYQSLVKDTNTQSDPFDVIHGLATRKALPFPSNKRYIRYFDQKAKKKAYYFDRCTGKTEWFPPLNDDLIVDSENFMEQSRQRYLGVTNATGTDQSFASLVKELSPEEVEGFRRYYNESKAALLEVMPHKYSTEQLGQMLYNRWKFQLGEEDRSKYASAGNPGEGQSASRVAEKNKMALKKLQQHTAKQAKLAPNPPTADAGNRSYQPLSQDTQFLRLLSMPDGILMVQRMPGGAEFLQRRMFMQQQHQQQVMMQQYHNQFLPMQYNFGYQSNPQQLSPRQLYHHQLNPGPAQGNHQQLNHPQANPRQLNHQQANHQQLNSQQQQFYQQYSYPVYNNSTPYSNMMQFHAPSMQQYPCSNDAAGFLESVQSTFRNEPETYAQFLAAMEDYKLKIIGYDEVVTKVHVLFRRRPELLKQFSKFL